jgi:hypothetical protein
MVILKNYFVKIFCLFDKIFRWRRWGSSLPGLRMLDPPLCPPSTPVEVFWPTSLGGGVKNLINFLSPNFCFTPKLIFFFFLKPHIKFQNPTITPSGGKVTRQKEKEKR